jgi:hypothetical protein
MCRARTIAAISEPAPALDTPRELLPDFLQDKPPGPASCASSFPSCSPTNRRSLPAGVLHFDRGACPLPGWWADGDGMTSREVYAWRA